MPILKTVDDLHCSGCGETVPDDFDVCWNCGTDRAGAPNRAFVPAVALRPTAECRSCGYLLHGLPSPTCPECGTPFDPTEKDTLPDAGDAVPSSRAVDLIRLTRAGTSPGVQVIALLFQLALLLCLFALLLGWFLLR